MQIRKRESRNVTRPNFPTFHAATFPEVGSGTLASTMRFFQNWQECYLGSTDTGLHDFRFINAK